jgi:peptidoglycan/xylan/chitin deacetylase (PgdA/CDA1 family)
VNIFIGFAVLLFFVVVSLGFNSNVISLNIVSVYGIIIETPFENNYQNQNNNSSDNDLLVFDYLSSLYAKEQKEKKEDKFVILMFDRGYQSIFFTAKPIMDKFGFKASIFIACDYIENGDGMNWNQVRQFYNDGYDIQSHGLSHTRLTDLKSENEIQSVISVEEKNV